MSLIPEDLDLRIDLPRSRQDRWTAFRRLAASGWREFVEFCYPGACAMCDTRTDAGLLCPSCYGMLVAMEHASACNACAMPLVTPGDPCPYCEGRGLYPYERVVRLGVFEDPIKHLVHLLKFQRRWPVGEYLADRLLEHDRVREVLADSDLILATPLHATRHILRGYNQADVVAGRIARRWRGVKLVHPLVRLRATDRQTELHAREARMANMHEAFGVLRPGPIQGKRLVVVDDVMTTGATLKEIGRTLLAAGASEVRAIIVAVADPKGRGFEAI